MLAPPATHTVAFELTGGTYMGVGYNGSGGDGGSTSPPAPDNKVKTGGVEITCTIHKDGMVSAVPTEQQVQKII